MKPSPTNKPRDPCDVYRDVGRNIRARRQQLGMTIEDLAEASGLQPSHIGHVERDVKKASLLTLERLASALGIAVARLFGGTGPIAALASGAKIDALLRTNTSAERKVIVSTLRRLSRSLKTLR